MGKITIIGEGKVIGDCPNCGETVLYIVETATGRQVGECTSCGAEIVSRTLTTS